MLFFFVSRFWGQFNTRFGDDLIKIWGHSKAAIIQSLYIDNLNKNKPTIVVLYSCRTGYGDNCFGQQLSRELELSIVIAPEGFVWAGKNKEGRTTIENAMGIPTGLRNRPYIKGLRCNWSVFYKGKRVMSFNYSAPQAWIKKQGGVDKVIDKVIKQYEK